MFFRFSPIVKYTVVEESMMPMFFPGDTVLVCTVLKSPHVGDAVVAKDFEDREILKRVQSIQNRNYFLVGDNQKKSIDSRTFGPVPKNRIVGKIVYILRKND